MCKYYWCLGNEVYNKREKCTRYELKSFKEFVKCFERIFVLGVQEAFNTFDCAICKNIFNKTYELSKNFVIAFAFQTWFALDLP